MTSSNPTDLTAAIREFLPREYGRVTLNFDGRPENPRIGIVIPTFSRPDYVRRTLTSLRGSNLPEGCLLVIVDETTASKKTVRDGFAYFENIDFEGGDIRQVANGLEEARGEAPHIPACVAYNEAGWLKHTLANPRPIRNSRFGTYIRTSYLEAHPAFHREILQLEKSYGVEVEPDTVSLIESFDMDLPMVKIFKTHHRNMFDSLKAGFDLLAGFFQVSYLVNLDSDTLHSPDWLSTLLRTHEALQRDHLPPPLILSGFNADKKRNLRVRDTYVVKEDLGGINLFFDVETYSRTVRKTLTSIGWDIALSGSIREQRGTLAAVRRSVVQHIGREGMWSSQGNHDYSSTFKGPRTVGDLFRSGLRALRDSGVGFIRRLGRRGL